MRREKEKLVDFCFVLIEELGMQEFLRNINRAVWLRYPLAGVRQAAQDMLETAQDIEDALLTKIDLRLKSLNLPTLTNMRKREYKKLIGILSRKVVKNEQEWRLLRSFSDSNVLSGAELSQLRELLDKYEHESI